MAAVSAASQVFSPSVTASASDGAANMDGIVSVKHPQFGVVGDGRADDTEGIQSAANFCFGSPDDPHGTARVSQNRVLYFPPGIYTIRKPIRIAKLHGGRIIGAGRFVTEIANVNNGGVFSVNGSGYSHFEGLYLRATGNSGTVFDLNWDGTPGGAALQSNTFIDILFGGGGIGIDIGAGGFMGSENLFLNCFWARNSVAGLKTSNFNALQNTLVGGNLQTCGTGVWVWRGSVCAIESVGFQQSKEWDIRVDNSANDTICILGCRTESANFIQLGKFVHAYVAGCTQIEAGTAGYFAQPDGCPTTIERCVSTKGQIAVRHDVRLTVRGSSFGRLDWLHHLTLNPDSIIELEDVRYGGTPNSDPNRSFRNILKQRITSAGVFNYKVESV